MYNFLFGYSYNLLVIFWSPIPIFLVFRSTNIFISDVNFTCFKYPPIGGAVLLWCQCVREVLNNIISYCCCISCTNSTIIKYMLKIYHIITATIKDKLLNIIKVFFRCSFIGKIGCVPVFEGAKYSSLCAVHSNIIFGLFLFLIHQGTRYCPTCRYIQHKHRVFVVFHMFPFPV